MIIINEIAKKLEDILNGEDYETTQFTRPTDFEFSVATEGFHLDHIYNANKGRNFIPVFISSLGGQYDAVPNLKRATNTFRVDIYFPVRFKDQFFALNEYLVNCFVATKLDYGSISGRCLSNISVAQYGEITDLDLRQFAEWTNNLWKMPQDIMEPYMSMTFTLYLTYAENEFIYGNDVSYSMSFDYNGNTYYEDLIWTNSGTGAENSPISQQLIDDKPYATNVVNITNYNKSIIAYIRNNDFWLNLIGAYNKNQLDEIINVKLVKIYDFDGYKYEYEFSQLILSINENVSLGDLLTMTITFGDEE